MYHISPLRTPGWVESFRSTLWATNEMAMTPVLKSG